MKAVVCTEPFAIEVIDRPDPVRKTGEVLVQIRRVGLCGTDFHIVAGDQPFLAYPRVMGHELAGEILETDPGSSLEIGQLVTINPYLSCHRCVACLKGKPNCCVNIRVLGVHTDGGMAEYLTVPESAIIPVHGLTANQAAMVEFLAIGAHALRRGGVQEKEDILVVGAGPIGVGIAIIADLLGARVTLIDVDSERLAFARTKLNVGNTALVDGTLDATLKFQTGGAFYDVVFDATGNGKAIEKGFSYIAHGGRYVLVSIVKSVICFSDPEFHKRETTLLGSRNATNEDFHAVIDLIRNKKIPTDALQTQSFSLMDTPQSIRSLMSDRSHVLKAIGSF